MKKDMASASPQRSLRSQRRSVSEGFPPEFFEERARLERDWPALPLRQKPCADCAVIDGLYQGISNDLRRCSFDIRVERSLRWFCHDTPTHACRGNAANQGREVLAEVKMREARREATINPLTPSSPSGETE